MCGVKEALLNRDYFKKILSLLKQKGSMILMKQVKESAEEPFKSFVPELMSLNAVSLFLDNTIQYKNVKNRYATRTCA